MATPDVLPHFLSTGNALALRARRPLSAAAVEGSRRSIFDTLAVTAAGTVENCTRAAYRSCADLNGAPLSARDVALILGTASHALDYDDVCMLATCHPSAPPISALLGLLPQLVRLRPQLTLGDFLAAYLVGAETTLRLGEWLGFKHYSLGFHATSTLGSIGSAAAAAHAMNLPSEQVHNALSIAASSAGGLRANFGTDTKPLHVGFAASAGVRAALLASAGARASNDVWGPSGFELAFSGGQTPGPLNWHQNSEWTIVQPGFELKRFPSCYLSHRLIAGVLAIRGRLDESTWSQAVHIDIEVARHGLAALKYPQAKTGLEGKFSGPYCAAAAWLDGRIGLDSFTDSAVLRQSCQNQMQRINLRERDMDGESLDTAPVRVTLRGDGWREDILVDWAPGSLADPMTRSQMEQKWQDCVNHGDCGQAIVSGLSLLDAPLDFPAEKLLMPIRDALMASILKRSDGDVQNVCLTLNRAKADLAT
ncbi:MAG: MmgE/PrpD family protein [Polaromonas sp.]|nr:MmgE/PrpD family protein [Polaromonas sp.]